MSIYLLKRMKKSYSINNTLHNICKGILTFFANYVNILKGQKAKSEILNRYAVKLENARRCFENDNRIRRETFGRMGQHQESRRLGTVGNENLSEYDITRSTKRREESTFGVSRKVSGEVDDAYKHFLKLYDEFELQENLDEVFKDKHIEVAARKYGGRIERTIHKDENGDKVTEEHAVFDTDKGKVDFIDYLAKKGYPYFENRIKDKHSDNRSAFSIAKSLRGAGNTDIKNLVATEELNPQQKLIYEFSKQMGMDLQFFRNDNADFHGAHNNGVTYLNVNSKIPLGKVFWHEALHWLRANNENLYNQLAKSANLTQEQLTNYLDETGRKDLKDNAEITEEILADAMQEVLSRVKDKNILQKVVAWIQNALNKFKEMFRNPTGGLTNAQYDRIANAFGKMAKNFKDEDGNALFRFNKRTKQLELANGENISDIAKVANKETLDNEADMNENIENEIFKEQLETKHKNFAKEKINAAIRDMDFSEIRTIEDLRNFRDNTNLLKILNHNFHKKKQQQKIKRNWLLGLNMRGGVLKMTSESRNSLLVKWITAAMDNDKETFMEAEKLLYPNSTSKELETDFAKVTGQSKDM